MDGVITLSLIMVWRNHIIVDHGLALSLFLSLACAAKNIAVLPSLWVKFQVETIRSSSDLTTAS